jgi:STELLO glycosyltransferases
MKDTYAIIITTINYPTRGVKEIARNAAKLNAQFILIGDLKSPQDFAQPGATFFDLNAQRQIRFKYASLVPARHYARKNIGYLVAISRGATILIETDDDNIPREDFWLARKANVRAKVATGSDWINIYSYYSDIPIWPRGFPLDRVNQAPPPWDQLATLEIFCPIQQGLADGNPDVDAIYRLLYPLPFSFRANGPVALRGPWCPFNSQNTTWCREAFPLLYLPYYCSFRMTDIWRSFVAQRIAYLNRWGILFHKATVFQQRNDHSLLRDFEEEVPGYLNNGRIREVLDDMDLPVGQENIPAAMRAAYQKLVAIKLIGEPELPLLDAWIEDLSSFATGKICSRD